MKFVSMRIKGFGKLVGRELSFSPEMTLIVGPNEAGKSTLQRCISALLYGLSRRGHGPGTPAESSEWAFAKPWEGAPYEASLHLRLSSGEEVFISKDFSERDRTSVQVVAGGRDISREIKLERTTKDLKIGEYLLGLSREEFEASALVKQYDVRWEKGGHGRLAVKIESLVDSAGKESAHEALMILDDTIGEKVGTSRTSRRPLDNVRSLLANKSEELLNSEAVLKEVAELSKKAREAKAALEEAEEKAEKCRRLGLFGEFLENEERIRAIEETKRKAEMLRRSVDETRVTQGREAEWEEINRWLQEMERKRGEHNEVQKQLDGARPGLADAIGEIKKIGQELWGLLAALQLVEGDLPELPSPDSCQFSEVTTSIEESVSEGINAEEIRQHEVRARIAKEQTRRTITAACTIFFGAVVAVMGSMNGKIPVMVAGGLLLVVGMAGLISLPALRRRYREALAKLPDIGSLRERAEEFRRAVTKAESYVNWIGPVQEREKGVREGLSGAELQVKNCLRRAGATGNSVEELQSCYAQLQAHGREYDRVRARLDAAEERLAELAADGSIDELRERSDELRVRIGDVGVLRVQFRKEEDYLEMERLAREDLRERAAELESLRSKTQAKLEGLTPPGKLRNELKSLREEEARLLRFRTALDLAKEALAAVGEGVHARWSKDLNSTASGIIEEVTGGRYESVMFSNDLSPALKGSGGGLILAGHALDACLSEGTKDQLYFSARAAVARKLSSMREPLPIILDDPLTAFDRERLNATLSVLTRIARQVQVLLLTCRADYEAHLLHYCEEHDVEFAVVQLA